MKKIFFLIFGLAIVFSALYNFLPDKEIKVTAVNDSLEVSPVADENKVKIGGNVFLVDIADDSIERYNGLSGRKSLSFDAAMLFIFDRSDRYAFWMRGMFFPIDIIWISNGRIIGFSENLPPDNSSNPKLYYPPKAVDLVLEVNAGQVKGRGIKIGDTVEIQFP